MKKVILFAILLSAILTGCASLRYPGAYRVEGKEFKNFEELDDERALKLIALIYNVKGDAWEDGIARSIALEEYLKLLAKRKSEYVKKSGASQIKYDKVKLSTWKDEDLAKLYNEIALKTDEYYMDSAAQLTEVQNADRIVKLTALSAVARELKTRDEKKNVMVVAAKVLAGVLSIALSMI